ncbi:hypothetical protein FHS27_006447 [Rhodopirellula rubra]|uniref:Uncharacterized protein n=1 Tax=Aporhodopirellula rubra TaxID=980271 RepID=A0A7W5E5I9_9BACT|nr:hypothetical protein [Aporhodopirellula rubra]MBB3210599.1 hypothetical protein [Aporhodopirellula rubra]
MIRSLQFRTVFIVLLVAGPFLVLPFLALMPALSVSRAAWGNVPRLPWRIAVSLSVVAAFLLTLPHSPMFVGLDGPIPLDFFDGCIGAGNALSDLVATQCYFLNAGLLVALIMLPVNAAHSFANSKNRFSNR